MRDVERLWLNVDVGSQFGSIVTSKPIWIRHNGTQTNSAYSISDEINCGNPLRLRSSHKLEYGYRCWCETPLLILYSHLIATSEDAPASIQLQSVWFFSSRNLSFRKLIWARTFTRNGKTTQMRRNEGSQHTRAEKEKSKNCKSCGCQHAKIIDV